MATRGFRSQTYARNSAHWARPQSNLPVCEYTDLPLRQACCLSVGRDIGWTHGARAYFSVLVRHLRTTLKYSE
ncbi:hypothetical protein BAUCODRAFT_478447 [Baudoinia panamericana UAMH 10762]|uniref:Uncharacterized protein n=1 Tax=Baudoinia panamericana (strain UAMH 10762) TaxID=717646 RepID=M2MIQ7_BAUPA|nr:uncharacterized protein BAUCODRAFT_478447 [Baudoinia panamericana UAMH 10762]EMC96536.1 hypothetical protein BAUCODRAFT_478447 [Baudoinia panamericana UAMH 10762]